MKKLFSIILILSLAFCFSSCGDNDTNYLVSIAVDGIPSSLDPQVATSDSELAVIYNTCEGLMRFNQNGDVEPALAKDYTVSSDRLTYTFTINDSAKWNDGENITADDFVFAFRRIVSPETKCPAVDSFLSVINAEDIYNGKKDVSELGVSAQNDKTFIINLSHPDDDIIRSVATSFAMPCRKEFFEKTKGKYGLNSSNFISSGPFYLKSWFQNTEIKYLKLSPNSNYSGSRTALPSTAIIYFNNTQDHISEIYEGQLCSALLSASLYKTVIDKNLHAEVCENRNYIISLNPAAPIFSTREMRRIFSSATDRKTVEQKLSYGCSLASSLIPGGYGTGNGKYNDRVSVSLLSDYENLSEKYLEELKNITEIFQKTSNEKKDIKQQIKLLKKDGEDTSELEALLVSDPVYGSYYPWDSALSVETDFTIIYPKKDYLNDVAQAVASGWEKSFGITVATKALSEKELFSATSAGNYFAAIIPLSSFDCNAKTVLRSFSTKSLSNIFRYANKEYDDMIDSAFSKELSGNDILNLEQYLISDGSFIPLIHASDMIPMMPTISNIKFFSPKGYIDLTKSVNQNKK